MRSPPPRNLCFDLLGVAASTPAVRLSVRVDGCIRTPHDSACPHPASELESLLPHSLLLFVLDLGCSLARLVREEREVGGREGWHVRIEREILRREGRRFRGVKLGEGSASGGVGLIRRGGVAERGLGRARDVGELGRGGVDMRLAVKRRRRSAVSVRGGLPIRSCTDVAFGRAERVQKGVERAGFGRREKVGHRVARREAARTAARTLSLARPPREPRPRSVRKQPAKSLESRGILRLKSDNDQQATPAAFSHSSRPSSRSE